MDAYEHLQITGLHNMWVNSIPTLWALGTAEPPAGKDPTILLQIWMQDTWILNTIWKTKGL